MRFHDSGWNRFEAGGFNPKAFVFREDEDFLGNGWGILFPLQGKVPADRFDPALPRVQNVNHVIIL
jgi:hypothetical protein